MTRKKALQHDKLVIHLDMDKVTVAKAVELLKAFIHKNEIEILNVAGSRGSKDPDIYSKAFRVVEESITKPE